MNTNSHARTKNGLDARLFGRLYDHKKSRTNLDLMPVKLGRSHHQMITSVDAGFMMVKDHTSLEAEFLTVYRLTLTETIKHVKISMPDVGSCMRSYQCGGLALFQYRRPYEYDNHARTKAWTCCQKETGTFGSNKEAFHQYQY